MRGESCFFLGCRRPYFIPRQLSSPGLASRICCGSLTCAATSPRNGKLRQAPPPRVRHCPRRSRESDARSELAQRHVPTRHIPCAEHVTQRSQRALFASSRLRNEVDRCQPPRAALGGQPHPTLNRVWAAAHAPARATVRPRNSPDRMCSRPAARDGKQTEACANWLRLSDAKWNEAHQFEERRN